MVEAWSWDVPLRLFGGVRYLALSGTAPDALSGRYDDFRAAVAAHADFLRRFVAEQAVQTNEVQRCFTLLPAFLVAARQVGPRLELVELGPSAGLNLLWDRYRYVYAEAAWGPEEAGVVLTGDERGTVPAEVLATPVEVRRRRGIDLAPVDVRGDEEATLLRAFVWPGQPEREARLLRAIETLRSAADPPELVRGNYLALLPDVLAGRAGDAGTVVFQTASTIYLRPEELERLRAILDQAGRDGGLAFVSTLRPDEEGIERADADAGWAIELTLWPPGERRVVARADFHGRWLDWRGA